MVGASHWALSLRWLSFLYGSQSIFFGALCVASAIGGSMGYYAGSWMTLNMEDAPYGRYFLALVRLGSRCLTVLSEPIGSMYSTKDNLLAAE